MREFALHDERLCWDAPFGLRNRAAGAAPARFPADLLDVIRRESPGRLSRLEAPTGCALRLNTDAAKIAFEIDVLDTPRGFGAFVARSGAREIGSWRSMHFENGPLRVELALDGGGRMRDVEVLLPHLVDFVFTRLEVRGEVAAAPCADDAAYLAVGDSVTQGMNAVSPASPYVRQVRDALALGAWNLGVGGAMMEPPLFSWAFAARKWRLVTIALGSNDWIAGRPLAEFRDSVRAMLDAAAAGAPQAALFLVTPPPTVKKGMQTAFPREAYRQAVIETASESSRAFGIIEGDAVVDPSRGPHTPDGIHLSDEGFTQYAAALLADGGFKAALLP